MRIVGTKSTSPTAYKRHFSFALAQIRLDGGVSYVIYRLKLITSRETTEYFCTFDDYPSLSFYFQKHIGTSDYYFDGWDGQI